MDVELLARIQFSITIMFHYIYPPLSIGLGLIMVIMEGIYLKTRDKFYLQMAKFWTKIFALTFALGVATGIVMEFEFGTNWATYSRYVGDVFGSALAAEGVFAFFLESGFLAILLFGWNRVGPKLHFFSSLMVCLGAHFSAVWIVVANSWMQTPAGFEVVGEGLFAKAHILSFWDMVFNPSSMIRLAHTLIGAWLAGAFLVISISAFYLLQRRYISFSKSSMKIGLLVSVIATLLQLYTGDLSAKLIAKYQPAKLAAFEGLYTTQKGARAYAIGWVDSKNEQIHGIGVPGLLSYMTYGDFDAEVTGLDKFPKKDWPNVSLVFQTYHLMIMTWAGMFFLTFLSLFYLWRGTLFEKRGLLWLLVLSVLLPQIGNQVGWMSAEVGRYPWIVYNLLRISDGLSKVVTASQVLGSIIMFGIVYFFLFILFIYLLDQKIRHGPTDVEKDDVLLYPNLKKYVKETE